jgi:hypothetical protein
VNFGGGFGRPVLERMLRERVERIRIQRPLDAVVALHGQAVVDLVQTHGPRDPLTIGERSTLPITQEVHADAALADDLRHGAISKIGGRE